MSGSCFLAVAAGHGDCFYVAGPLVGGGPGPSYGLPSVGAGIPGTNRVIIDLNTCQFLELKSRPWGSG